MPDPIDLRICPACNTGIPAGAGRCPECGAALPPLDAPGPGSEPPGIGAAEMADIFDAMFGGATPASKRAAFGPVTQTFLGQKLGCLGTLLLLVFGVPVLVGALAGNALGGLAWALLAVGVAGLGMTSWLVWLVWPARKRGR